MAYRVKASPLSQLSSFTSFNVKSYNYTVIVYTTVPTSLVKNTTVEHKKRKENILVVVTNVLVR